VLYPINRLFALGAIASAADYGRALSTNSVQTALRQRNLRSHTRVHAHAPEVYCISYADDVPKSFYDWICRTASSMFQSKSQGGCLAEPGIPALPQPYRDRKACFMTYPAPLTIVQLRQRARTLRQPSVLSNLIEAKRIRTTGSALVRHGQLLRRAEVRKLEDAQRPQGELSRLQAAPWHP
jgi:hypothetical protein